MRVTIEHREEAAGVSRTRRNYFVDCTVQFSEEERAIIKARHLHDHNFTVGAAEALPSTTALFSVGILRAIGFFLIIGAVILGLYSGFAKTRGEGLSEFMLFLGIGLQIYGWRASRKQEKLIDNNEQWIKIRDLLSKGRFTVYATDPASATIIEEDIRIKLTHQVNHRGQRRDQIQTDLRAMNIDDWLQWPTKSTDPAANAAIAVLLAMVIIAAVVMGALFLLPVVLVIGLAKGIHWYVNKPTPTDQLYAQAQQRSITANFPATDKFLDAHIDRFIDAIRDDLPAYHIYLTMVRITEAIYEAENLNNPLPPMIGGNAIEEGRYRDQLIAHQRKTADAPRTLELINGTLAKSYLDFIAALPSLAKSTPAEFAKCDEAEPFATFPLIDVLPDAGKTILSLILPFFRDDVAQLGLFADIRTQLDRNFADASGTDYPASSHKLIMPETHPGSPREIVGAYLHDTPFEDLFYAPVPFSIPESARFEHTHILGGIGHGKTQLTARRCALCATAEYLPRLDRAPESSERVRTEGFVIGNFRN